MPDVNNEAQRLYQNLVGISFEEEMISHCVVLRERGQRTKLLYTLQSGCSDLLNHIHPEPQALNYP